MPTFDLSNPGPPFNRSDEWYRQNRRHKTGLIIPTADGRGLVVQALPGEVYTIAARSKFRAVFDSLDSQDYHYLLIASLAWWWYRVEADWKLIKGTKGNPRPTRTQYALKASRRGSDGCKGTWGHCDYCEHSRAMVAATRFLAHGTTQRHVIFSPIGKTTPADARNKVSDVLTAYVMLAPYSGLSAALIAPSYKSGSASLSGRLHIHVLLQSTVWNDLLKDIALEFGLNLQYRDFKDMFGHAPHWQIAYVTEQIDARVFSDPSLVNHQHRGPIVWSRWESHIKRIGQSAEYAKLQTSTHRRNKVGKLPPGSPTGMPTTISIDGILDS